MREMIQMVVVLTILSCVSGILLASIESSTKEQIAYQQLKFVKGPAIRSILEGAANDPIVDRFRLKDGEVERDFFVGVFDGQATTVAFETSGKGYGGEVGLMIGVNLTDDNIVGVGVTTHSETPGVGSRAKDDPAFAEQFKGMPLEGEFKVKTDGGQVDALSGATLTSRGVATGVSEAVEIYKRLKSQLADKAKEYAK
jgi:electron transport complex protein RnfG